MNERLIFSRLNPMFADVSTPDPGPSPTCIDVKLPLHRVLVLRRRQVQRRVLTDAVRVRDRAQRRCVGVGDATSQRDDTAVPCDPQLPVGDGDNWLRAAQTRDLT